MVRLFHKYRSLSGDEKRLLRQALALVVSFRVALWVLPFRTIQRWLARVGVPSGSARFSPGPQVVATAVMRASRWVPRATCLTQALAARALLARAGHASRLQIGVARGENDKFEAHAWVEHKGEVLIGGSGTERFTPVADLADAASA